MTDTAQSEDYYFFYPDYLAVPEWDTVFFFHPDLLEGWPVKARKSRYAFKWRCGAIGKPTWRVPVGWQPSPKQEKDSE